jgi:Na+(H+)/acetate symporter ActP
MVLFHQFHPAPVYFDANKWEQVRAGEHAAEVGSVEEAWGRASMAKRERVESLLGLLRAGDGAAIASGKEQVRAAAAESAKVRDRARRLVAAANHGVASKDSDYIFIGFVVSHFPPGVVGLLLAVILCAAMSAVAAALDSLGTTSVVDFYRPIFGRRTDEERELLIAKSFTVVWGLVAVGFAMFAARLDNLIQAVNILGSIFYGPMLGVFLVGFFLARVRGTPVFIATLGAQALVIALFAFSSIGFLWYNVLGCAAVIAIALLLDYLIPRRVPA